MKKFYILMIVLSFFLLSACGDKNEITENALFLTEQTVDISPSPSFIQEQIIDKQILSKTDLPKETEEANIPTIKPTAIPTNTPITTMTPVPQIKPTASPKVDAIKTTNAPTKTEKPMPIIIEEPINEPDIITEENHDIYDIVLFFGQSNMNAWPETNASMPMEFYEDRHQYSIESGIDEDILNWTTSTSTVSVPISENIGYVYDYLTNSLDMITPQTYICGDGFEKAGYIGEVYENSYGGLKYNPGTQKLEQFYVGDDYISCQTSPNQNMIPEFCRRYHELTGHKVISVMCSVGGAPIECFLPATDEENYYNKRNKQQHYIYEGLVENFNSAVKYAEDNGLNIQNKYWICFQGEGNLDENSLNTYYEHFIKVKNNLANDIKTTKGAIVYTSNEIGKNGYENTFRMHKIQSRLIEDNPDIICGSSFDWNRYIPCEEVYYSENFRTDVYIDENGEKLPYETALSMARKITSYEYNFYDTKQNNAIHLLSCALSQIGRDSAENLAQ